MEITVGTTEDGQWIREQLITYNRQHVPGALYTESETIAFWHGTKTRNSLVV